MLTHQEGRSTAALPPRLSLSACRSPCCPENSSLAAPRASKLLHGTCHLQVWMQSVLAHHPGGSLRKETRALPHHSLTRSLWVAVRRRIATLPLLGCGSLTPGFQVLHGWGSGLGAFRSWTSQLLNSLWFWRLGPGNMSQCKL